MTIKDMHYDLKKKLNKVDSEKYRNLLIPEIDWALNEAQELYIKLILQPKLKDYLGSSMTQRTLDDIYTIVRQERDPENSFAVVNNVAELPHDYWYYLSSNVTMSKGACLGVEGKVFIRQHDDEFERSSFDFSSFAWRTVNMVFFTKGVRFYPEKDAIISSFQISYVKRLRYIHNAEDFRDEKYALPSGELMGIVSDAATIVVDTPVTVAGTVTLVFTPASAGAIVTESFPIGASKNIVQKAIVEAIRQEGSYDAYLDNTKDYQVNVVGAVPITAVTYTPSAVGASTGTGTGSQVVGERFLDCELPPHTHREIVDLAAMSITGDLGNAADYQFKQEKMKMNLNLANQPG